MTEKTETPKILDELSKSNSAKATGRASRQQNARRRFAIIIVLLSPLLGAIVYLAYQQNLLQRSIASLSSENQQLNSSLSLQSNELQQLQQIVSQPAEPSERVVIDDSAVRQLEDSLNEELIRLRQSLAELRSQQISTSVEPSSSDWKVLEAEYLLGLANQKLQLEADTASAIVLLETADAALLASANPDVFSIRQAIASELLQLRNVSVVDRQGIYLRIENLSAQFADIEMTNSMRQNYQNQQSSQPQSQRQAVPSVGANADAGFFDSSLEFLSSIFVWRKWDESPTALMEPGQEYAIKQNLQLLLEQAQLSLLMRDRSLYQSNLSKSSEWLRLYAVVESPEVQILIKDLDELALIDIAPPLPSVTTSLELSRELNASERQN